MVKNEEYKYVFYAIKDFFEGKYNDTQDKFEKAINKLDIND